MIVDLDKKARKAGDDLIQRREEILAENTKPPYKEFLISSIQVEKIGLALIKHEEYVLLEDLLNCPELADYLVR